MKIFAAFQQLLHVALDLRFCETNRRIFQHAREIVIHVGGDHEHVRFLGDIFRPLDGHLDQPQHIRVIEGLE